jgi:non-haem dioxygenase in morphine synthesis N-terminal
MGAAGNFGHIPIIDVSELVAGGPSQGTVAGRLGDACRESGFFYVVGHGVDEALQARLRALRGYPVIQILRNILPTQETHRIHQRRSMPRCVSPTPPT